MTQFQSDVMKVVYDLIKHGVTKVKIERHVFGTALTIYPSPDKKRLAIK